MLGFLPLVLFVLAIPGSLCWFALQAPRGPAIVAAILGLAGWALLAAFSCAPDPYHGKPYVDGLVEVGKFLVGLGAWPGLVLSAGLLARRVLRRDKGTPPLPRATVDGWEKRRVP